MSFRPACAVLTALLLSACSAKDSVAPPPGGFTIGNDVVSVNPGGYAPLTAQIHVETSDASRVTLTVVGRHGTASDVVKSFDDLGKTHDLPVLGLYPDFDNTVRLTFADAAGAVLGTKSYTVRPAQLRKCGLTDQNARAVLLTRTLQSRRQIHTVANNCIIHALR